MQFLKRVFKGITVKPSLKPIEGEAPVFQNLDLFRMSHSLAVHAGTRHSLVAQNIANADVLSYRAKDLAPFSETYKPQDRSGRIAETRDGHIGWVDVSIGNAGLSAQVLTAPKGETISLQDQMLRAVESKRQHDRALAIYRFGMNVLRASLGR